MKQSNYSFILQYFDKYNDIQYKLLKADSLPNETSDTISFFCKNTLKTLLLDNKKCIAFWGDNTNTNF